MLTMTEQEIDFVAASFRAWCTENGKLAPSADDAAAYFAQVQNNEPMAAELIDHDWEDFLAFLQERRLLRS